MGDYQPQVNQEDGNRVDDLIARGEFDPNLVGFLMWSTALILMCTIYGIILVPFILPCLYPAFKAYYRTLEVSLSTRSLQVRSGGVCCNCCCFARKEKTILLDRIQDLSLSQGCLGKCFGLWTLTIETAGQAGPQAGPEATMNGLLNARAFRDTVLQARHRYVEAGGAPDLGGVTKRLQNVAGGPGGPSTGMDRPEVVPLLVDIRDTLHRIEKGAAM